MSLSVDDAGEEKKPAYASLSRLHQTLLPIHLSRVHKTTECEDLLPLSKPNCRNLEFHAL
jgi:hypothetical protein